MPALLLLATVSIFFLYYQGTVKKIRRARAEIKALEEKIKKDVPEARIKKAQAEQDSLILALNARENRILPYEGLGEVGPRLQVLAKGFDLQLTAVKPDYASLAALEQDTSDISELPITVEVKGKYTAYTRFLDGFADLPFAMRASGVEISRSEDQTGMVRIAVKGGLFLKRGKAAVSKREPVAKADSARDKRG